MKISRFQRLIVIAAVLISGGWAFAGRINDLVLFQVEETGPVRFSHYRHLEALGKNCVRCHNDVFHIVPEKNPTHSMADMAEGKSCGACHNGRQTFGISGNCTPCHPTQDVLFPVPDVGDVTFSHDAHTTMYGCSDCHPAVALPQEGNPEVTMQQMEKGSSCGACHDASTAFSVAENCEMCHAM